MSQHRKILIVLAASSVALLLFISFVLPGMVRTRAVTAIAKITGRQTTIQKVALNPFTLRARVDGFSLAEADGKVPFASFSSLSLRLSPASLVRRALVVGDMTLTRPRITLVRVADNRYNVTDIVDRIRQQPKSDGETHFSLNNIRIEGGSLDFDDRAARTPARHTVRDLSLAIPFISNIPYMADRYVTPHFAAVINDAPLRLEGKLKPLEKSAETVLHLQLYKLNLPHYLAYVPFDPGFAMPGGTLSTDLDLAYRVGAREKPELNIAGTLQLAGVTFTERGGAPLCSLQQASVQINRLGIFRKEGDLGQISVDGPALHLRRDRQGIWNLQRLLPKGQRGEPPAQANQEAPRPLPPFKVAGFSLRNGTLQLNDALPGSGFVTALQQVRAEVKAFSTAKDHRTEWDLGFSTDARETVHASGTFGVAPILAAATVKLQGLRLQRYYPYLAEQLTAPLKGVATVTANLNYDTAAGLRLAESSLSIADLLVPFGATDNLHLKAAGATGIAVNLKERQATVDNVTLQGGAVAVTREADGSLSPRQLLRPAAAPPAAADPRVPAAAAPPFRYLIRQVGIAGVDARYTDKGRSSAPSFHLKGIAATLKTVAGPTTAPIPFTFAAGFGDGPARISANGTLVPAPFSLKGQVALNQIPLRDFDAYYPDDMGIFIAGGTVDTRVSLDLFMKDDRLAGSYNGSLGIRSFYSLDTDESEDLLKWEQLQMDSVRGTLQPFSLAIKDIALSTPFARVIVNKDGTLNLQHLGKAAPQTPSVGAPAATPVPTPAPVAAPAAGPAPVAIDAITIQNGTLAFIDRKLPGGFSSTFFNLGGRVSGLSSEASRLASVDLRGVLDNQSPLKIGGTINPLRGDLFLDLTASFTDIELSPVTPYSGTYLGYTIDKGKLFLDMKYKIENKALAAENKVFIDQFTFGRAVASDKATNLPVRLAVALLKDNKGEIHLDLPVTGRTDDPKFSAWKVILQMLKNLLVKAATSPFSLLASMLGDSQDFSSVTFAPGSARLTPTEQDKLLSLAKALKERPAVSLEMTGYADRERDAEGYRQEQLLHKIRTEKFLALAKARQNKPDETADQLTITPEEYPALLRAVYRKEDFPKPRNAIGMLKDLPDAEMKKLLLTHLPAGEKELQGLARERAAAVQVYLRDRGGMPRERLFLKQDDPFRAPEKAGQSNSRVEFGVVVK
jgi:uncharacterized protein involved in outer membrane biogenesis/outer membrane protein OmpA-like peptidoglycan-associated protein